MKIPDRFIVVDDDSVSNMICRSVIKEINSEVEIKTFTIPEDGFEYIVSNYSKTGKEIPTVLFLDINMPSWTGWDFLKHFEKLDECIQNQIKVYMLTSSIDIKDKEHAQEDKIAVEFIVKPLTVKIVSDIFFQEQSDFGNVIIKEGETVLPEKDNLDLTALKKIASDYEIKYFKKKEILYKEGRTCNGLYFILKGKIKTYKTNDYHKELITGLHKQGDFLGYLSLLENINHHETAVGLEDGEVCMIPKEVFKKLVAENPEINQKFIQLLSKDLFEKEKRLLSLAYDSVRQRVAGALLDLQKKYQEGANKNFSTAFTRDDLAAIVGTATESLIRSLSDLKEERAIEISSGVITIKNQTILEKIRQ